MSNKGTTFPSQAYTTAEVEALMRASMQARTVNLRRNIALACGHNEGLATLHRGEETAWCPVCEADVEVEHLTEPSATASTQNRQGGT